MRRGSIIDYKETMEKVADCAQLTGLSNVQLAREVGVSDVLVSQWYADFERYKVECLGQDWEDAYDSLPQDDFRYGMLRALEIIDKHTSGKEQE